MAFARFREKLKMGKQKAEITKSRHSAHGKGNRFVLFGPLHPALAPRA
jgi:hypothetical protein